MTGWCYDCGRRLVVAERIDGFRVCACCGEMIGAGETVGFWRALFRRILFRWHSNTADRAARGWRR